MLVARVLVAILEARFLILGRTLAFQIMFEIFMSLALEEEVEAEA